MKKSLMPLLLILIIAFSAQMALGQCEIIGTIEANATNNPSGPDWAYTMTIDWDTGSQHGLSHLNLLMDSIGGTCSCADFMAALSWNDPIGSSDGHPSCPVNYEGFLECGGDPSIPGVDGVLLKFEPVENGGCEPGRIGTATFVFYSDLGPAPIDGDILTLVEKDSNNSCFGTLTGVFPTMTCDPVSTEDRAWGSAKGLYR